MNVIEALTAARDQGARVRPKKNPNRRDEWLQWNPAGRNYMWHRADWSCPVGPAWLTAECDLLGEWEVVGGPPAVPVVAMPLFDTEE